MANIYKGTIGLIGNTPLVEVANIEKELGLEATILVKLEYFNPAGSVKDRIAKAMIEDAEEKGLLKEDSVIIEPTSGNTGIGLAAIGCTKGYRVILTMPDTMSVERRNLVKAYGAEVVLTPGALGMQGSVDKAEELARTIPGAIVAGQFTNPANPAAHYATTGPEIWADCEGLVDALVAGVGTGGTISGTGRYLKEQNPAVHVVAVQPAASPLLTGGVPGPHAIQGIGANFIPATLDRSVYDEVISVDNDTPLSIARELGRLEGVLVGISSGAALWAATQLASRPEWEGRNIVVIMPDGADRYYSTPLFCHE
jgi:cysteine synthase A